VRSEYQEHQIAPIGRDLFQRGPDGIGGSFEETGVVVEGPQFVDFRSARSDLNSSPIDVLLILAAT
jgi:hypothetical protein